MQWKGLIVDKALLYVWHALDNVFELTFLADKNLWSDGLVTQLRVPLDGYLNPEAVSLLPKLAENGSQQRSDKFMPVLQLHSEKRVVKVLSPRAQ